MKFFCVAGLMLATGFTLVAETNSVPVATETLPKLLSPSTNVPSMEVQLTDIHSHGFQFFMKSNVIIYREDVRIDDPRMKLTCELLTVEAPRLALGKYNRATAETNVVIDWTDDKGPNHATADKAVYTYVITNTAESPAERWETNSHVILSGNSVVTNVQGTIRADPIVWDRIKDVISSTNFQDTKINQSKSNSPGLFESPMPSKSETSKPKTDNHPK